MIALLVPLAHAAGATPARTVSISTSANLVKEGTAAVVTLSLTGAPATSDVIVNLKSADGTAIAGSDYTGLNTTIRWHPGDQSPKMVSVPTLTDNLLEPLESFSVSIADVRNAAIGTKTVTFSIVDANTPAPAFHCTVFGNNIIEWDYPPYGATPTYILSVLGVGTSATYSVTVAASDLYPDPTGTSDLTYRAFVNTAAFSTASSIGGSVGFPAPEDGGVIYTATCKYAPTP